MSTDPISEARRAFAFAGSQACAEQPCPYIEEDDEACGWCSDADVAFDRLVAAILAADPRRAALETALRKIADDDHRKDDEYAGAAYDRVVDAAYRALKALEETAVEETRS